MINILIPLAGKSTFKTNDANSFPKILNEIDGKLLVERAANAFVKLDFPKKVIIALPKEESKKYRLDKVLSLLSPDFHVCHINGKTQGAVCSALLAIEALELDKPLIVSSFEQVLDFDLTPYIETFIHESVDAGVLTFDAIHPKWSYVSFNEKHHVFQAAEKNPISRHAVAGFYFFKTASVFIEAAKSMIRKDEKTNDLFYIAPTLNEIILKEGVVKAIPIDKERYFHINDEHALENFEEAIISENKTAIFNINTRTNEYISAFDAKDIGKLETFFADDFVLTDPSAKVSGKEKVIEYIANIFDKANSLSFKAKKIIVSNEHYSVIEFELNIDGTCLIGTDVIRWGTTGLMLTMDAYLYEKNESL
ncbi:nuclear transport factor 2 family protein [Marinomonas shanghaiensis]|uniref:nuclear transport factor 2 family protein n=1 Tax=Marinomonas shanghaiensis TaxID=2202418 RepID=UPI003A910144